jgi:hypothetical protein
MNELPEDWDVLYLNGTEHRVSGGYTANLKRVKGMWGCFGYILHSRAYDRLITGLNETTKAIDSWLVDEAPAMNFYRTAQPLIFHLVGYSYRQDKNVNYHKLKK